MPRPGTECRECTRPLGRAALRLRYARHAGGRFASPYARYGCCEAIYTAAAVASGCGAVSTQPRDPS